MKDEMYYEIESYLKDVRTILENLSDKELILNELRAHIWDLANDYSQKNGISTKKAFTLALQEMEAPKILAQKFLDEEQQVNSSTAKPWLSPAKEIPEYKITDLQFLIVGILGLLLVLVLAVFVAVVSDEPFAFIPISIFGTFFIGLFIFILYHKDNQIHQEQLNLLRVRFKKWKSDTKPKIESLEIKMRSNIQKTKKSPFWGNLGGHLEGLGSFILLAFLTIVVVWVSFDLFGSVYVKTYLFDNESNLWMPLGFTLVMVIIGTQMIQAIIQMLVGKIQISRLISSFVNIIVGTSFMLLVIFYPFTVEKALVELFTVLWPIVDDVNVFSQSDIWARIILGFIAVVKYIYAFYDIIKFGIWKSEEQKSLLI